MSQHQNLRNGNLVLYVGGLRDYYNTVGEIFSINKKTDEDTYQLKIKDWKKEENIIVAYKNEIWPINLELYHLEKLGFKKDEKVNIYKLNGLTIVRPILSYNGGQGIIDKGFVVVVKKIPLSPTEEQIDEATIPVTSLHFLQNYFSDNLNQQIDRTLFL